jgi:hypothetical protein
MAFIVEGRSSRGGKSKLTIVVLVVARCTCPCEVVLDSVFPYVTVSLVLPRRFHVRPFFYSNGARGVLNVLGNRRVADGALSCATPLSSMKIFRGPRLSLDVWVDVCILRLVVKNLCD